MKLIFAEFKILKMNEYPILIFFMFGFSMILAAHPSQMVISNLLHDCPNYNKNVYSPQCPKGILDSPTECQQTVAFTRFTPHRFFEIDDRLEKISLTGMLVSIWHVENCHRENSSQRMNVVINPKDFWKPSFVHINAAKDSGMVGEEFYNRFFISMTKEGILVFVLQQLGRFIAKCRLNLDKFPFDEQICTFLFTSEEVAEAFQTFGTCRIYRPDQMLPGNFLMTNVERMMTNGSFWKAEEGWCGSNYEIVNGANRSVARYSIRLRRIPTDYIFSILLPTFLLSVLELTLFLLPPKETDRPLLSLSIALSLTLVNGFVADAIPKKANRVFLAMYVDTAVFLTFFCTVYFALTTWHIYPSNFPGKGSKIGRRRVSDLIAFSTSLIAIISVNAYSLAVAFG